MADIAVSPRGTRLRTSIAEALPSSASFRLDRVLAGLSSNNLAADAASYAARANLNERTPQSLGQFLASRLADVGVRHIFNVPGDFSLILLDQLMLEPRISLIQCCNELNAGYAADGYARASGIGCISTTYGVGSLSCINAIAGAYAEDMPVILIAGNPPSAALSSNKLIHHSIARGNFNFEVNCYKPVTCYQAQINHIETAYSEINRAIIMALTHRKPVYISIASNLAAARHPSLTKGHPLSIPPFISDPSTLQAAIKHTAEFFAGTVKPVIVVGALLRSSRAQKAVIKLAETSGFPVAVAPNAKGFFPEDHPNFIGVFWVNISSPFCGETITIADKYLFIGPVFNDVTTVGYTHPIAKDRLVDVQMEHVSVGTEGFYGECSLEAFIERLTPALGFNNKALLNYKAMFVPSGEPLAQEVGEPILTKNAYKHIQRALKPHHVVLADAGDSWFNACKLKLPGGAKYEIQMQYASIGWSLGATLGHCASLEGKKASNGEAWRPVLFIGDGAFQMTAQELSTIIRYGYSPIIYILNNGGYTVEVQIHDGPYNVVNNWNYFALLKVFDPEGMRSWGTQVRTEPEMIAAVAKAFSEEMLGHTIVIEIILDKDDCSRELLEFGARLSFQANANANIVQ